MIPLGQAQAAPSWDIQPTLNVSESYTDNLTLASENEAHSLITEIAPSIRFSKAGAGLKVSSAYQLRYIDYASHKASDQLNHNLSLNADAEVIEDLLFVDVNARHTQQLTDRRDATTNDVVTAPDNFSDVTVIQVRPRWRQQAAFGLGKRTTIGFDLNLDTLSYNSTGEESDGYGFNFFLDTRANPGQFFWSLEAQQRQADAEQGERQESESINVSLGYRPGAKLTSLFRVGYVDNHLDNPPREDASADYFWGAELIFHPSNRTDLSLNYNSQLLSTDSRGLTFSHRKKNSLWTLSYEETISSTRQELLRFGEVATILCPVGNFDPSADCQLVTDDGPVVPGPNQQIISVIAPQTSLVEERFILTSTTANVVLTSAKSTWNLGAFMREREFDLRAVTEQDTGFNAGWTWRVSGRTWSQAQYTWSRLETEGLPTDYLRTVQLSALHQLTPRSRLQLVVERNERDSAQAARGFIENRLTIGYTRNF